jgi:hypothetical protein
MPLNPAASVQPGSLQLLPCASRTQNLTISGHIEGATGYRRPPLVPDSGIRLFISDLPQFEALLLFALFHPAAQFPVSFHAS